jgi:hypothetical protein
VYFELYKFYDLMPSKVFIQGFDWDQGYNLKARNRVRDKVDVVVWIPLNILLSIAIGQNVSELVV